MQAFSSVKGWMVAVVLLGTMAYAVAEDLTLTTYYPSPRGVYKELRASGDVAIGTTSAPDARLQVIGSLIPPGVALHVIGSGGTTTLQIDDNPGGDTSPFLINSAGDVAIGTTDPGGYKLRVLGSSARFGTTATDTFTFTNSRIGIGTTNPSQALDVEGQIRVRGGSPATGKVLTALDDTGTAAWQSAGSTFPTGMIAMFNAACPLGWTRLAALDGRFPLGGVTYGTTGGGASHTHNFAAPTPGSNTASAPIGSASYPVAPYTYYSFAGPGAFGNTATTGLPTAASSELPPYLTVIWCRKD
ncbi:MAG: hypothetical protein HYY15_02540 [Candidatus Omnitrophica bacterium]|nr:hypothetical protein [Candidatus Omnitrophota bacterium]